MGVDRPETQVARDLVWALSSPAMLSHPRVVGGQWGRREVARNQGLLSRLDSPKSALASAARVGRTGQLGDYFEALIRTWIDQIPPATLIAHNTQVHHRGHTIGEFDVIFERDQVVSHWELALKFYLGYRDAHDRPQWVGPDPVDRLADKWAKMRDRQMQLADKSPAKGVLRQLGVDHGVESRGFIKGYFFDPLDTDRRVADHPEANRRANRGWWAYRGQFGALDARLDPDGERRWMVLPRRRWMSPARVCRDDNPHGFATFAATLGIRRPNMVVGFGQTPRGWTEETRGFVVPDAWPVK